ncbi:hypothetical protein AX16_003298 [Volvariella volvacea WC 439]|nr:hypothetical protein AX16_003298 [Volvariella volvacea WC 439]
MIRSAYLTVIALFCALFLGVQVTSVAGAALPDINTNAGRLARGLPLLTPRFTKTRDLPPTRVDLEGYIKVIRANNGNKVGYISNKFFSGSQKRFKVDNDDNDRLLVKFYDGNNFNIEVYNGPGSWNYLGWTTTSGSGSITNTNSSPNLEIVGCNDNPSSTPASVGNSYNGGASSSRIWSYNSGSDYLSIQWVNPDGAAANTKFWYNPSDDSVRAVRSNYGGAGYEVYLKFWEI